jgi:hypothetical protein
VLARLEGGSPWDWAPAREAGGSAQVWFEQTVNPGTRLAVAGTRSGLARLLLATRAPHRPGASGRMDP